MKTHLVPASSACCVCGLIDARALVWTRLADNTNVVVCGTHETVHRRTNFKARTVDELRAATKERREGPRRESTGEEVDELGAQLSAAFTGERRMRVERRRSEL